VTAPVLGIDPGTAVTGYGVVEPLAGQPGRLRECGVIRAPAGAPLAERLRALHAGVAALIATHHPEVLAVESIFYGKNVRTTVTLGQARGVVLLAAAEAGLPVAEFAPAVVKKTVAGGGRAAKAQVGYMVQQLLKLKTPPEPADAADGVALALTYLLRRFPNGR